MLTASVTHGSLFQLDGFIAPDRSVSTVPRGDHREMSSKVGPKTLDCPNSQLDHPQWSLPPEGRQDRPDWTLLPRTSGRLGRRRR